MTLTVWGRIAGAVVAWGFAAYLSRVPLRDALVWRLCVLLFWEGFGLANGIPIGFLHSNPDAASLWSRIHLASDWVLIGLYLPFLGIALPSQLTRPFRSPAGKLACGLVVGAGALSTMLFPAAYITPTGYGAGTYVVMGAAAVTFAYAFCAAIVAWRAATGLARDRARAFTLAFGLRDIIWCLVYATFLLSLFRPGVWRALGVFIGPAYGFVIVVYVPLIAYGILKLHLFDIDLRLKWAIRKSTVAAAFLAVFFVVSQVSATLLSQTFGNVLGVVIAAAVMMVLRPLEKFAGSLADAALPNAQPTANYETFKKLQVYHAALEAAYEDGLPSSKKQHLLRELRASLGIGADDATRMEEDIRSGALVAVGAA